MHEDELTFSASVDGNGAASVEGSTLTVVPDNNYFGDIQVTIVVSDGQLSDQTSFILTVVPINNAPIVILDLNDITVNEDADDAIINLSYHFADIDSENLNYIIEEDLSST